MVVNGVKISKFVEDSGLEVLHKGSDFDTANLTIQDVNRPGLQFHDFYDYFDRSKIVYENYAVVPFKNSGIIIN